MKISDAEDAYYCPICGYFMMKEKWSEFSAWGEIKNQDDKSFTVASMIFIVCPECGAVRRK